MFALESKVDGINARVSSLAARFENRVRAAAQQVMGKATLHKVQPILVSMPNSLDGTITYAIEVCGSHGIYTCNYEVEVKAGEAKISADALKDLFEASERQSMTASSGIGLQETRKFAVDMTKLCARRAGSYVVYTTPELPLWNLSASVETLRSAVGRDSVKSEIISNLKGYVLAYGSNVVAELSAETFDLPAPESEAPKAAVVKAEKMPWMADVPATFIEANNLITQQNITASKNTRIEDIFDGTSEVEVNAQNKFAAANRSAVVAFLASSQKAVPARTRVEFDFSGTKVDAASGFIVGDKISAKVEYLAGLSYENSVVEMPLDGKGGIVAKEIKIDESTIGRRNKVEADLKVLSDEEAEARFREHVKSKNEAAVEAAVVFGVDILAQSGSNLYDGPAMERIPVLKATLPLSAPNVGDTIEIAGYVYEVCLTNHLFIGENLSDNPWVMLTKTDKKPGTAKAGSLYGSLGGLL
jgi:hypothetical protein